MNRAGVPRFAIAVVCALSAACLTARDIADERGRGETRCYATTYEELWPAAEEAVRTVGLVPERANRENGILVARTYEPEVEDPENMALDSDAGERVAVFLELDSVDATGRDIWTVEVVSRPIFSLDVTPRDWTRPVFLAIESLLPDDAFDPDEDAAACTRLGG